MLQNEFTLQDYLEQLQKIRNMGSITQLLGMIPGMSKLQSQIDPLEAEKRLKKTEAIIQSMTLRERSNPKLLDASRKRRIAKGSGTQVRDINELIQQYRSMKDMMKNLRRGNLPNLPGLGGLKGRAGRGRGGFGN